MIQIRFLSFLAITLFGIHCSDPVKTYPVKGVIVDLKPGEKIVVVDHDTIPDLMMPMVMPFKATLRSIMFFYFRYKNESEVSNATSSSLKLPSFSTYAFSIAISVCESLNNSLRPIQ